MYTKCIPVFCKGSYLCSKHQLELISFIRDYCNGICGSVLYVIKCNGT